MRRIHISVSVRGLMAQGDKDLEDIASCISVDDKRLETAQEVRDFLDEVLSEGWEYLPATGCDNFDPKKGCLGHEVEGEP